LIAIPYSYLHPREVVETNVLGTLNVMEAARSSRPHRVVHISTSEVYGTAQRVPIDENHPLQGQSPYSASKIGADKVAESYHRSFDVPVVTVRPFNTYGPRQSARAVIPTIITQALVGEEIALGSLTPTRDLTFVSDTVGGMLAAAEAEDVAGLEINLGTGTEISIGDLAQLIFTLIGKEVRTVVDETRLRPQKSEVGRLLADNRLAADRMDWKPSTTLEEGLKETIEWIREHLDSYRPGRYEV
jgi:dTDP-glucose 4,6-dehydratase